MSKSRHIALDFGRRFWRAQKGATAVTVALFMTVIVGTCGFVIDLGHLSYVQRQLQASADAAALAGASKINCCSTTSATSTATAYSATSGGNNPIKGVTATMATGYPALKCFTSTGVSCTSGTGIDKANGIVVKEQASVPMWFSSIFGLTSIPVSATATAGVQGGPAQNMDIEVVLDTTHSMTNTDTGCSVSGATRLGCAEAGLQGILQNQLSYSADQISLLTFPSPTTATVANDYNCSGKNPTISAYSSSSNYSVLGLGNDFKTKSSGSSLNTSSNAVRAIGAGKSSSGGSCPGMQAPGGEGTYYAGALSAAVSDLKTNGRSGVAHVIIILTDGDANASGSEISSTLSKNECAAAVTAAQNATKAGDIVIPIAYGASTSTSGSCSTDGGNYSACSALEAMASAPKYFLAVNQGNGTSCNETGAPVVTDVVSAMGQAIDSLGTARLLPDNTN